MNVLYINTYFAGGGAEKVMRQLFYNMDEDINTSCIIGRKQNDLPNDVQVIYKSFWGRAVTTIMGMMMKNTLLFTVWGRFKLIQFIKKNKIDLVHFHNIHGNYIGLKDIKTIKRYCPNIVITLHDMWVLTGGCAHAFDCEKWKTLSCEGCSGNVSMKKNAISKYLCCQKKRALAGQKIRFVTPSQWLKQCCQDSYLKGEDVSIINNGISIFDFHPNDKNEMRKKYCLSYDKHLLLFIANGLDNPYKGFSCLCKALSVMNNKEKYALIVVGNKNNHQLDLPFEIYMMGYISDTKTLCEIYSAADLFILPSLADNFPCTAMEAMASGTPVVAFETGGIPEIVSEDTGWIVSEKSGQALAQKIEEIFQDQNEAEYNDKKRKCRERIEELFDERMMASKYAELYRSILHE